MAGVLFARSIGYYLGMKHKIKNLTNSPYALSTVDGAVTVPARGEIVAEFDVHQVQAIKGVGYFRVEEVVRVEVKVDESFSARVEDVTDPAAPKRGRPRKDS